MINLAVETLHPHLWGCGQYTTNIFAAYFFDIYIKQRSHTAKYGPLLNNPKLPDQHKFRQASSTLTLALLNHYDKPHLNTFLLMNTSPDKTVSMAFSKSLMLSVFNR